MKTRSSGAFVRTNVATKQMPSSPSGIDALANAIFARLHQGNVNDAAEDLQLVLAQAANTLARPSSGSQAAIQAALQRLSTSQREALRLHHAGLTCAQIARRQAKADHVTLEELASAYVQLRLSLDPGNHTETHTMSSSTKTDPP
jgi:hypothetical protein